MDWRKIQEQRVMGFGANDHNEPAKMVDLASVLSLPVLVLVWFILKDLHTWISIALLLAEMRHSVQLGSFVLINPHNTKPQNNVSMTQPGEAKKKGSLLWTDILLPQSWEAQHD